MSGICGIYNPDGGLTTEAIDPMLDALALSDEAEREQLRSPSLSLGVARRWPFQTLARWGHLWVAADADLIGLRAVAEALSLSVAEVSSMSTAELIAWGYDRFGVGCLKLLRGSFAVAIWNERERHLFLAIDRVGIKSLYWRLEGNRLLFASRAGAIRVAQSRPSETCPAAIMQFLLFSSVPAPLASDRGMAKLQPGTWLMCRCDGITEHRYWDLEYPESEDQSPQRWADELREGMRTAVHRHFEDCTPATSGCYLSGGTDSSSVVAFASEVQQPIQTFSIAFSEAAFSEIEFARTTAAQFSTCHHEKFLKPQDASAAIERIINYYDEPFANSSAIGSFYCAALARQNGVRTLFAGDGGDELFGGNERYATDKRFAIYHEIPGWLRRLMIEPLVSLLPNRPRQLSLVKRYVRRANIPNPRRILSYGFFLSLPPSEVFEDGFLQQTAASTWLDIPQAHFDRAKAQSELNRILYLDLKMTLADNDLRKVSGTAELAGINVRYPLLDDKLAELSGRIPSSLKLRRFEKRYIFKQAMKDILPAKVLYKKKHGFGVPLAQWLLQNPRMKELMLDLMHDPHTRQRGYFRPDFFERLMRLHRQEPNFYGEIVWYLVALELWHRTHLERR